MPVPVALLLTIGAVGAAGAAIYATEMHSLQDVQQNTSKNYDSKVKLAGRFSSYASNKKLRIGHRDDIHVLMFVVGKD